MIVNRIARNLSSNFGAAVDSKSQQVLRLITIKRAMVVAKRPKAGDHVRVKEGVFQDVEGTILERIEASRVVIALHLLQQGVTLEIDEQSLEIVG